MKPFYFATGLGHTVAAIYQPATGAAMGTAVLLVPPFGWDEQTSYRPRRDWSLSLAASGFSNVRIDFPGSGDSSGNPRDPLLVDAWTAAVGRGVEWLRAAGGSRVAVIALGAGGLVTLQAIARGACVDDLVLWGVPARGRTLIREIKAFGRLEQSQTGEPPGTIADGEVRAGGHLLTQETVTALSGLDAAALLRSPAPDRALVLGRDGTGPDAELLAALRSAGVDVRTDPGRGWGAALDRPQSTSPRIIFETVNAWLAERAHAGAVMAEPSAAGVAELGAPGARICETPIIFHGFGRQLYAVLAEPVDASVAGRTVILFNAGAIRRIGPNRMWTEAARRWAAAGVPVVRIDVEGVGDAAGDASKYAESDDSFYTGDLVEQSRAALGLAAARGLPNRFVLGGLCSGAFWSFQLALSDPRIEAVVALNPRMLFFDPHGEGGRELRKLPRILTARGFRNLLRERQKMARFSRLARFLLQTPLRIVRRPGGKIRNELFEALHILQLRGQRLHMAFSEDEPLYAELRSRGWLAELERVGIEFHELPYRSHTLKPLEAQKAAHAMLDQVVGLHQKKVAKCGLHVGAEDEAQSEAWSDSGVDSTVSAL